MKLKYITLLLFCPVFNAVSAQTLDQARTMFTKGLYEKAKPVFERYVKSQPNNANYNYWYGVCCLKTGEIDKSTRYLEFAAKKKIQNAPLYLGQAYDQIYRFEEAVEAFEEYIEGLAGKKQPVEKVKAALEKSKTKARMIKGVEDVCIVDSIVVDKAGFLSAYKISEEAGRIHTYADFFNAGGGGGTVYENELGNRIYYGKAGAGGGLNIFCRNKLLHEWSKETELPENINAGGNTNYPFVLSDGMTVYYASDGAHSTGGYDIFVTRYNSRSETFLAPENVGMPFNSPANDYMYVIDEYNNLGWFATDRNQPKDKVCIYVFVPNASRSAYNYEAMDRKKMRNLAKLNSIRDTWKDGTVAAEARKRLAAARAQTQSERKVYEFTFVINDRYIYHHADDFRSPRAKELFGNYRQMEKDCRALVDKLDELRSTYAGAGKDDRNRMGAGILDLEERVRTMGGQLDALGVSVRNEEIKSLNK
ncbi:MAG: tetratricopeptide repeat protein [Mediterranea sp.]|jgi:tetratricopeptide (TPR) repeat protein|nr:tetratricopeptide repeat protein [Mediterranea sp.]